MRKNDSEPWEGLAEGPARLDQWLHERLPGYSRRRVEELIAAGRVRVDGRPMKKGGRLKAGQVVVVFGIPQGPLPAAEAGELVIAYEDSEVLVVEKPAGQPTHPLSPEERGTLVNTVLAHRPELRAVGEKLLEPGLLHRLDAKTQGLVLFAKTPPAFAFLQHEFKMHRPQKIYRAIVRGGMRIGKKGEVSVALAHHPREPGRMVPVVEGRKYRGEPRPALTRYKVLATAGGFSLLQLELVTGVMHQLRVHLAFLGHPVVGEDRYGDSPEPDSPAYALQAAGLNFLHPRTGEKLHVRVRHPLSLSDLSRFR